jgi:hypothetical protein
MLYPTRHTGREPGEALDLGTSAADLGRRYGQDLAGCSLRALVDERVPQANTLTGHGRRYGRKHPPNRLACVVHICAAHTVTWQPIAKAEARRLHALTPAARIGGLLEKKAT